MGINFASVTELANPQNELDKRLQRIIFQLNKLGL